MFNMWLFLIIWIFLTVYPSGGFYYKQQVEQKRILSKAREDCEEIIRNASYPTDGVYCNMTFDNVLCWNYTVAGTVATQRCPAYIHGFTDKNYATRICNSNGSWAPRPGYINLTFGWTNYSECKVYLEQAPWFVKEHMYRWRIIYNVGYSLSLACLIVAITILSSFRKLRCHRNRIHLHLFVSFAVRASMCLIRDNATVLGVAFQSDFGKTLNGNLFFIPGVSHWKCKLLYLVFYYSLLANYAWVTNEGIFLYRILFCHADEGNEYLIVYEVLGWVLPLVYLVPWALMRYFTENYYCWNTHSDRSMWFLHAFMFGSIVINTFFFVRISVLIIAKLSQENRSQRCDLLRLAKSMLILISLFGMQYIILLAMPDHLISDSAIVVKSYMEHIFNSFQGFVISVIFCFLNKEVRTEIGKSWSRYKERNYTYFRPSTQTSITSNITRERNSLGISRYNTKGSSLNGHLVMHTDRPRESYTSYHVDVQGEQAPLAEPEIFEDSSSISEAESTVIITNDHRSMLSLEQGNSTIVANGQISMFFQNQENSTIMANDQTTMSSQNQENSIIMANKTKMPSQNQENSTLMANDKTTMPSRNQENSTIMANNQTKMPSQNQENSTIITKD